MSDDIPLDPQPFLRPWQEDFGAAARDVLAFFDGRSDFGQPNGPWEPGDFVQALLRAFARADLNNRARLRQGFPALAFAFTLWHDAEGGVDELAKLARWPG